ncbi:MAG: phage major tail tube protein, partial [Helicobacteraceae bacterium]|nr:phage major tail tube protein [Helicobacteraceae bacterium]
IATGTLEKLECSFTLQEYSAAVFAATAAQKAANSLYIFKANILQDGTHKRAQALITGHIKEIDDGDWEAKKEIERKVTLSVASCALEIDGTQAVLIDADNLIYIVDGVDFLASARQNLQ